MPVANEVAGSECRTTSAQALRTARIVAVAIELAAEGGYEAVQMREVARRAGIALATLYRYYASKEELLRGAICSELDSLRVDLRRRPARQDTPAGRTGEVFARGFRAMLRNPGFAHAAMSAHQVPPPYSAQPRTDTATGDQTRTTGDQTRTTGHTAHLFADLAADIAWGPEHSLTADERRALQMVQTVWVGSTISWLNGQINAAETERRIRLAAAKLVG